MTTTVSFDFDMTEGHSAVEAERRARAAHRAGDLGRRVAAFYMAEIADRCLYEQRGFSCLRKYAEKRLGMKPSTSRGYARVGRALKDLPELDRMFAADQLGWTQVRLLTQVVTPQTERIWGEWAQDKTTRQIELQVNRRDKGDLPTDPSRRRIHTTKLTVRAKLNPVEARVWEVVRAALGEQGFTAPVTDQEMMMWLAHKAVRELLGAKDVLTATQPNPELDPRNQGSEVPPTRRHPKTGKALQQRVLNRDGKCCACCGSTHNLSAHHVHWRRYGGPTTLENLVTLCEGCHSLVHDRFLIVRGPIESLQFLDADGAELTQRIEPQPIVFDSKSSRSATRVAPAEAEVSFAGVPPTVNHEWWSRHRHLLEYRQRLGVFEFRPGRAVTASPPDEPVASQEGGLADLVGQDRVRESLSVAIRASLSTGKPLGHVLLLGGPGLGKSSVARAVARDLGGHFDGLLASAIRDPSVLIGQLTSLRPGSVLFLDEVHRLPARAAEILYDAMERGRLELPIRSGSSQRSVTIELAPFTLIAATTEEGLLPAPFRSRFPYQERMEFYDHASMGLILRRAAEDQGLALSTSAERRLVDTARDTPRVGLAILRAACDEARAAGRKRLTCPLVNRALRRTGRSPDGITTGERLYLGALAEAGGRAGLANLAAMVGSSQQSVRRSLEPFLFRRGLVRTTPQGRCLTERGWSAVRRTQRCAA